MENIDLDEEKRITLYFLGISLGYIAMVGGLLVFILLVVGVTRQLLGGFLSLYLSAALTVAWNFLHRPLRRLGLRKYFVGGSFSSW